MSATFTVNGNTYEIIRTNYLIAEFDKIKSENKELSIEENQKLHILTEKMARIKKLTERVVELENKFYETFDKKDEELYERAKAHFEKEYADVVKYELELDGLADKANRNGIKNIERLVIKALQVDRKGNQIRKEQEAKEIWESFVEENGTSVTDEWLAYFMNYITGNDKVEDDPFVTQAKAKAEQKANMRKGILKAK